MRMNTITTHQTLDIEGEKKSPGQIQSKVVCALAVGGVGILLMQYARASWNENNDVAAWSATLGFLLLVSAPFVLAYKHIYLDFAARQIVTEAPYAWFCTSKKFRPLTDFSRIVVRHLCIPGGEGPDTYTGSVGLKPVDGKAVLWVKNFPATEDEFPREAQEFARSLEIWTGLPRVPGNV